jgi:hypothetical protein
MCQIVDILIYMGFAYQVSMHSADKSFESGIVLSLQQLI